MITHSRSVTVYLGLGKTYTMQMKAKEHGLPYSPICWLSLKPSQRSRFINGGIRSFLPFICFGILFIDEYDVNDALANAMLHQLATQYGITVFVASQRPPAVVELPQSFSLTVLSGIDPTDKGKKLAERKVKKFIKEYPKVFQL